MAARSMEKRYNGYLPVWTDFCCGFGVLEDPPQTLAGS